MTKKSLNLNAVKLIALLLVIIFQVYLPLHAEQKDITKNQQAITIGGVVTDMQGEPLTGVSVAVKGTTTGTLTDIDGKYSITVPSESSILVFSYIGFTSEEINPGRKREINVQLLENERILDEVVVVAYGTQKKETVTGAISSLKGTTLTEIPAANITNTLAGKLPGVTVSQNKGRPGDDAAKIYIRGRGSWEGSSPLVVIDGIEQERFDQMDPNEIESISVLKDASATAVYGIRGGNGVILITTKRGMEGRPRISLTANLATQKAASRPDFLGSYDHVKLKRVAYENDNMSYAGIPHMSDEALEGYRTGSDPYRYPDVNWYDLMLKGRNNPMQQYNLNIGGGTKLVKYFVSVGYLDQDGGLNYQDLQKDYNPKAYFRRLNIRSNIDLNINKYITLSTNISGRSEEINGVPGISGSATEVGGSGGYYQGLLAREPWVISAFNPDGSIAATSALKSPIIGAAYNGYQNERVNYFDIIGTLKTDLRFITPGLNFDISYSVNNRYGSKKIYTDGHDSYQYDPANDSYTQITEETPFAYSKEDPREEFKRTALQLKFGYQKSIGLHKINALLVYNQQKTSLIKVDSNQNQRIPYTLMGYAARAEYSYANKYLAEVSMGYNGSENFAKGHRFGFFPAGSVGYVISEEKFWEPIKDVLPYLKFRGSIGLVGNDNAAKDRFLYMAEYATLNSPSNSGSSWIFGTTNPTGTGGIYEKRGQNVWLSWETATKKNIGLDGQLLKNQLLSFSVDFFREDRKDILIKADGSTPAILGLGAAYANLGKTKSWGYELELTHRNKIQNVEYSIKANYNLAKNKILVKNDPAGMPDYQKEAGYRIGQLKGYRVIGFFQDEDDIKNSPDQAGLGGKIIPGDLKYYDADDNGVINTDDIVPIGYSSVPEISYSINPSVSWKGITLSCMFQGVANASMIFSGNAIYEFSGSAGGGQVSKLHLDYWTPENRNASYPSLHFDPTHSNKKANSFLMQNASFLKLRDMRLAYAFPASICKRIKLSGLQVYVNGTNLHTWTKMHNWDPETINQDGDYFPQQRVYNVGLNINF